MNDFFASAWEWLKRAFGRSKTIFTTVMGLLAASWVELYDPIASFDWGEVVDKHEVAIAIGVAVQILNAFFKLFMDNGEASFKALRDEDLPVISVGPSEPEVADDPKVEG